jgi:hypothetical protein
MDAVTMEQLNDRLRRLPPEKLGIVFEFVGFLISRPATDPDARAAALASQEVLSREWDTPEEDEAWAHL